MKYNSKKNLKLRLKFIFMFVILAISTGSIIAQSNENNIIDLNYQISIFKAIDNYNVEFKISDKFFASNKSSFEKCNLSVIEKDSNDENKLLLFVKKYNRDYDSNLVLKENLSNSNKYYFIVSCEINKLAYKDSFLINLQNVNKHVFTQNKQLEIKKSEKFTSGFFINLFLFYNYFYFF